MSASEQGWREALRRFAERGIPFVVAQEHVAGRSGQVLRRARRYCWPARPTGSQWFYHRDKGMLGHAFDLSACAGGLDAAAALGVEMFGGDAIIRADGEPVIIDLNAWPSYALYRDRAAQAIAERLRATLPAPARGIVASTRN